MEQNLKRRIQNNPTIANSMDEDNNMIKESLTLGYAIKTFKLMTHIFNITFFLGLFWLIFT